MEKFVRDELGKIDRELLDLEEQLHKDAHIYYENIPRYYEIDCELLDLKSKLKMYDPIDDREKYNKQLSEILVLEKEKLQLMQEYSNNLLYRN